MINDADVFQRIGDDGFDRLTRAFYSRVATDELLGVMYPREELDDARERLRDFLIQRFGGPTTYSERRGHPRLRMRHFPFSIDEAARDRWLSLMRAALDECKFDEEVVAILWPYFQTTAEQMRNR